MVRYEVYRYLAKDKKHKEHETAYHEQLPEEVSIEQKQDCKHGMCLTRYCCNVCGFVPVEPFSLNYALALPGSDQTIAYLDAALSDYASKSFRPPRV